jgi:hypothetical protein
MPFRCRFSPTVAKVPHFRFSPPKLNDDPRTLICKGRVNGVGGPICIPIAEIRNWRRRENAPTGRRAQRFPHKKGAADRSAAP